MVANSVVSSRYWPSDKKNRRQTTEGEGNAEANGFPGCPATNESGLGCDESRGKDYTLYKASHITKLNKKSLALGLE
uniref:Uncharacterized protein n=1 Tax=Angiostrongylus cantonensis TaxID=6313 RepID=A0A0K0DFX6_ANGCA